MTQRPTLMLLIAGILSTAATAQDRPAGWLAARFERLDANNDGLLTPDELPRERLFEALDANRDGRITLEEAQHAATTAADDRVRSTGQLEVRAAIPYTADPDDPLLQLDVYAAREPGDAPRPIMVMIHGGGWALGDKANRTLVHPKAEWFVEQGFVFVSINYRLSPAVGHPVHAQDCAAAIAWVREHSQEFGGDPNRIMVIGHSAGAHLASLVSIDPAYLSAHGLPLTTIKAVVLLDGAGYDIPKTLAVGATPVLTRMYTAAFTNDPQVWVQASPITHIKAGRGIAPFLVLHAGQREASKLRSKELAEALKHAGISATLSHHPTKTHASINADLGKAGDSVTKAVEEFLRAVLTKDSN